MTIQELFIASNQQLLKVVTQIPDDQLNRAMPKNSSSQPTTLGQAVRYHTYDDAWVPEVLVAKNKDEVGSKYEFLLAADDLQVNYKKYNQLASEAVKDFSQLDKIVHLSYGDYAAREYLQHVVSFRAFRSYDIAKLIGANTDMDERFAAALMAEFSPVIEDYRKMGVFPPAIEVAASASPQTKLLAMVGRS